MTISIKKGFNKCFFVSEEIIYIDLRNSKFIYRKKKGYWEN